MKVRRYLLIALGMLGIDWILGALHAADIVPVWSFLVCNFPFGLPFVWLESHWVGTHYELGSRSINEMWSFVALFFAVFSQAWVYLLLVGYWQKRRREIPAAQ